MERQFCSFFFWRVTCTSWGPTFILFILCNAKMSPPKMSSALRKLPRNCLTCANNVHHCKAWKDVSSNNYVVSFKEIAKKLLDLFLATVVSSAIHSQPWPSTEFLRRVFVFVFQGPTEYLIPILTALHPFSQKDKRYIEIAIFLPLWITLRH